MLHSATSLFTSNMRSAVAIATFASVAAASVAPVAEHDYVDAPMHGEGYGADIHPPNDLGVIGEPAILPVLPEECYEDKDEHMDCDHHHVSPKRPIVYETKIHTVLSCEEEKVGVTNLQNNLYRRICHPLSLILTNLFLTA